MVLGGAGLVRFGMVAATGARILSNVDFRGNSRNLFVVAVPVGFGMIPLVAPRFFAHLPHWDAAAGIGILLSALVAVFLNAFFNWLGSMAEARGRAASTAAEHV